MKFEIIYSRKIRDAVAVFTILMFICQYGLTREDVAENFSRTAPTWGWFALDKPDWEISELIKGKFLKKILYNLSIFYLCYGY